MAAASDSERFTSGLPSQRMVGVLAARSLFRFHASRILRYLAVAALSVAVLPVQAAVAQAADGVREMWSGAAWLNLRLRHERVFEDTTARAANAKTVRARIGAVSAPRRGMSFLGEVEVVGHLGADAFNDGVNGETRFSRIPDPETAEINQLSLRYDRAPFGIVVGRQRIVLDRARFVGDADFRQNQQTFDAATVVVTPATGMRFRYDYMTDALRPGAPHAPLGSLDLDGHLLHAMWRSRGGVNTSAFAYEFDFEDAPELSTATVGARVEGVWAMTGQLRLTYEFSAAHQRDHGNNPRDFSLPYWLVRPGIEVGAFEASAGVERLDGNGRSAVSAPLGTLHAYQGFADLFTDTPVTGIEDQFLRADYKWTRVGRFDSLRVWAAAHRFRAATTGTTLGREVDIAVSASLARAYRLTAMAAHYDSETFGSDTRKYWLSLDITF